MRKTVQLVSGYNLMLQVPVVDYDSVMTVNGNSGINVAGQVRFLVFFWIFVPSRDQTCTYHSNTTLICRWVSVSMTALN